MNEAALPRKETQHQPLDTFFKGFESVCRDSRKRSLLAYTDEEVRKKSAWLAQFDEEQRESRARRLLETEKGEFLGQGYPAAIEVDKFPASEGLVYVHLERSMNRIWNEARMSYVYGFFQASVFQVGAVAELLIEQTLRVKGKWSDYCTKYDARKHWLGTLIQYCKDNHIVPADTLKDLSGINKLRITAVHLETEKENVKTAEDEHPLVEREDISVYEENQIRSKTILPGHTLLIGIFDGKLGMQAVHMYKPQAAKAFAILSAVFPAMRKLQTRAPEPTASKP